MSDSNMRVDDDGEEWGGGYTDDDDDDDDDNSETNADFEGNAPPSKFGFQTLFKKIVFAPAWGDSVKAIRKKS